MIEALGLNPGWVVVALIVVLLVAGMPIAFVLGIAAAIVILLEPGVSNLIIGVVPFDGANNYLLSAALLFMIAGEAMNRGGIARKLIDFASALVGHLRGGLAHCNILTSLFFSEISGSATADAAAIGSVMIPQMKRRGFPVAFAAAVTTTSATMAIIIPPSLNLILYAFVAEVSIAQLFAAGILPGIVVFALLILTAYLLALRGGHPIEHTFAWSRVARTGKDALLPLVIPLLILGGILGGVVTATEAGALAALTALTIAAFVYRTLDLGDVVAVLRTAATRAAMLLYIVATSTLLGWYLTTEQIPQELATAIGAVSDDPAVVLLLINVFFLLAGTVIHGTPAILMLVPIFLPLATEIGIDPVHFGLIVTLNLGIGQQTPPVASVLLITCSIARIGIAEVIPPLMVFIMAMLVALALINAFPFLSLWLPSVLV